MIVYRDNLKDTNKRWELKNKFIKDPRYIVNIQNCVAFLSFFFFFLHFCKLTTEYQKEKFKKEPYLQLLEKIIYLRINLIQKVQDLYSKCWKTFTKLIEHDKNNWEGIPYLWIGINIVIMSILPNQSTDSIQSLSKIQMAFFLEPEQIIIAKFVWKHKRSQTTK